VAAVYGGGKTKLETMSRKKDKKKRLEQLSEGSFLGDSAPGKKSRDVLTQLRTLGALPWNNEGRWDGKKKVRLLTPIGREEDSIRARWEHRYNGGRVKNHDCGEGYIRPGGGQKENEKKEARGRPNKGLET